MLHGYAAKCDTYRGTRSECRTIPSEKPESAWDRKRPCSPHSVGHSVKIKKYMVTHTRKSYSKGCNICIGNDGFFLGKRLSMGFHRSIVEPADPFELDPPTLKCAIPRFQRGPYYYHRSGRLCKFVTSFANFISAASDL